jgi:hypothetical protein
MGRFPVLRRAARGLRAAHGHRVSCCQSIATLLQQCCLDSIFAFPWLSVRGAKYRIVARADRACVQWQSRGG